jgi:hypothetical protein
MTYEAPSFPRECRGLKVSGTLKDANARLYSKLMSRKYRNSELMVVFIELAKKHLP